MTSAPDPQVPPAQLDAAASTFDLLSVPARLHLVILLATGEYDVTTLAELTDAQVPATSQQLAKLRAAGLVAARREGRRQLYQVNDPHIVSVIEQMLSHIAPDGTIQHNRDDHSPRRPRFTAQGA